MRIYTGFLALSLFFTVTVYASDSQRQVLVSGGCVRSVMTDRSAIILTAEIKDNDLKQASTQATRIYERVREGVGRLGLENLELSTVEYSLIEDREYVKDHWVKHGFKARMGLRVATSSTQKMGEVITLAARERVQDIGSLTTFLSDAKLKEEQLGCLKDAAEDAKEKASKLAGSLGAKLGDVISIVESGLEQPSPPRPMMKSANFMGDAELARGGAPQVEGSKETIRVNVNVSFGLKN